MVSSSGDLRLRGGDVVTTDDAEPKPGQLVAVAIEGRVVVAPLLGHVTGRWESLPAPPQQAQVSERRTARRER